MRNMTVVVGELVQLAGSVDLSKPEKCLFHDKGKCTLIWVDHNGDICVLSTEPGSDARWDTKIETVNDFVTRLDDVELNRWLGYHHVNTKSNTSAIEVARVMAPWAFV